MRSMEVLCHLIMQLRGVAGKLGTGVGSCTDGVLNAIIVSKMENGRARRYEALHPTDFACCESMLASIYWL